MPRQHKPMGTRKAECDGYVARLVTDHGSEGSFSVKHVGEDPEFWGLVAAWLVHGNSNRLLAATRRAQTLEDARTPSGGIPHRWDGSAA